MRAGPATVTAAFTVPIPTLLIHTARTASTALDLVWPGFFLMALAFARLQPLQVNLALSGRPVAAMFDAAGRAAAGCSNYWIGIFSAKFQLAVSQTARHNSLLLPAPLRAYRHFCRPTSVCT